MSEAENRRNIFRVRCLFGANILMWRVVRVCASVRVWCESKIVHQAGYLMTICESIKPQSGRGTPHSPDAPTRRQSRAVVYNHKGGTRRAGNQFSCCSRGAVHRPARCVHVSALLCFLQGLLNDKRAGEEGGGVRHILYTFLEKL